MRAADMTERQYAQTPFSVPLVQRIGGWVDAPPLGP
jgi:hypothetical protein